MRNFKRVLESGSSIAVASAMLAVTMGTAANAAEADTADASVDVAVTSVAGLAVVQQAAPDVVEDDTVDSGDVLIVTGTRRSNRTVSESPVPIDVIPAEQLRQSGLTETARLLRDLVPSLNFPQPSITDGTDAIRPATLRALARTRRWC